jgi:micrococcal nuclease
VITITLLFIIFCIWQALKQDKPFVLDQQALYPVTYVTDGDTFKVKAEGKTITVRMLGINTPETVDPRKPSECYGHEASDETKQLLTGKNVRLKLNPHREVKDKYGRYLAYVYREDDLFINEELLKLGFAREYTVGRPYSMQKEFKDIEATAKEDKKGLWEACK